jgi:tetratricopeptide (TPR) repeat protein
LRKALPVAKKLATVKTDPKFQDWLAGIYWKTGAVLVQTGDYVHALENFRQSTAIREPIVLSAPANTFFRTHLAADYIGLGETLDRAGDVVHALDSSNKAVQILEQLCRSNPTNATLREYLGEGYSGVSSLLKEQADLVHSLDYNRKANLIFEELLTADPTDSLAKVNLGLTDLSAGELFALEGKPSEAVPYIQKAISNFQTAEHVSRYHIAGQARAYTALGRAYISLADREGSHSKKIEHVQVALTWYQKSLQAWQVYHDMSPNNSADNQTELVTQELNSSRGVLAKLQAVVRQNSAMP